MTVVNVSGLSQAQADSRYRKARSIQAASPTTGTTLALGGSCAFEKIAANTWARQ